MFDEDEDDDGLGVMRGCLSGFVIMVLVFMIIGTAVGMK